MPEGDKTISKNCISPCYNRIEQKSRNYETENISYPLSQTSC